MLLGDKEEEFFRIPEKTPWNMDNQEMPHANHKEHLCYLEMTGFLDKRRDEYKNLVRNAGYLCSICGRSAADEDNLCDPDTI